MKIVDYYTVEEYWVPRLEEKVKEMIEKGWQPQGSMSVISNITDQRFFQTMVKYEDSQNKSP